MTVQAKPSDSRIVVFTYKTSSREYLDALRDAAKKLDISIASLVDISVNEHLISRDLPPLPPRTQGRYRVPR